MRKKKFNEKKILEILEKQKKGSSIQDLCIEFSISQATFYNWKKKYSALTHGQSQQLANLEKAIRDLKKKNALLREENTALKDILKKKR